jgi:alcohol dehydrogenase, propanol-preferring
MQAMVLRQMASLDDNPTPLEAVVLPDPVPGDKDILIRVSTCGVCHTELDEIEGRLPPPLLPMVLGHQVVGRVVAWGQRVNSFRIGDRVGVAWIHSACGSCQFCLSGQENLCPEFKATGLDVNGGYAEYMTVGADFAHRLPDGFSDVEAAPLLCAGAIGYRSLRLANLKDGQSLGLMGFGASAHLVLRMARRQYPRSPIAVFARSEGERQFARELGAAWTGDVDATCDPLSAIIDTTPAWRPVIQSLKNLAPGGRLVINAIRKEERDKAELQSLDYPSHLWMEKEIKSVANVTRRDVREFLYLASQIPIRPEVQEFSLERANWALMELKTGRIRGAKVVRVL